MLVAGGASTASSAGLKNRMSPRANQANRGVTVVGVMFETGHGHILTVRPELLPGTQDVGRYGPFGK